MTRFVFSHLKRLPIFKYQEEIRNPLRSFDKIQHYFENNSV